MDIDVQDVRLYQFEGGALAVGDRHSRVLLRDTSTDVLVP